MFKSLIDYTNELESSAEYTKEFLGSLRGGAVRLSNSIAKAEQAVKEASNERNYAARVKEAYKKEAIKLAKNTLFDATINALKKTQEFDIPLYRKPLFEAIENSDTYLYRPSGAGFNSILRVDINLNRTAGRLDIWGTAIKRTRQQLHVDIPSKYSRKAKREKAALQASRAWSRIYGSRGTSANSTYMETIRMRMNNAAKKGAFWELLDKGAVSISSDRGGYPTPSNKSLNFVDKSEKQVNELLKDSFAKEREKYQNLIQSYKGALDGARQALNEITVIVSEISVDTKKINNLSKRAQRIFKAQHAEKLTQAVDLIRKGLFSTKGIQLAVKGSYRGKRLSNETIRELLQ